ncbi:MAG: LptA/OstA family protein [Brevinema sp.]
MVKKWCFALLSLIPCTFILAQNSANYSPPIAITSGKSIFRTIERKIYLKSANNRRPTFRQLGVIFSADYIIYDEGLRIGYANGNLRFADPNNNMFISGEEGTYFVDLNKIVLRQNAEILMGSSAKTSSRITGKVITIYPNDAYIHIQGNIEVDDGQTFITGKEAQIWSRQNKALITGMVQASSDEQKMTAETLDIRFENGDLSSYTASGNVKSVNTVDRFALCSDILTYNNTLQLFRATENPRLYFIDDRSISFANVIEYDRKTKLGNLLGDVVTVQYQEDNTEIQRAYSRWATYDGSVNEVNMYGSPRLVQQDSELFGMQIIINIASNTMNIIGGGQGLFDRN